MASRAITIGDYRTSVKLGDLAAREVHDAPPPYPHGWFAVALSSEVPRGAIVTRRFMDREIVVFRTRSGMACAAEAYCPHLGAHFGHGGRVEGEELRCPFHGFRFSVDGRCTHSPYGPPPPAARLGLLSVREVCGVVLVWNGAEAQPSWEIEAPVDDGNWRPFRMTKMRFDSHPQEMIENSFDVGHLSVLHGYVNVQIVRPISVDGPRVRTTYTLARPLPVTGGVHFEMEVSVNGLGFSVSELRLKAGQMLRYLVLITPIGPREVDVRVGASLHRRGRSPITRAAVWPLQTLIERVFMFRFVAEVQHDLTMWENKKYLNRPAIAAGDGPIAKYRAWAQQFYPGYPGWVGSLSSESSPTVEDGS
jgi:nitrite reductase/ring-hydroxylating ferredoxin subunit